MKNLNLSMCCTVMTQNAIVADRDETVIIYFTKWSLYKERTTTYCYVHRLQLIINFYVKYFCFLKILPIIKTKQAIKLISDSLMNSIIK